MKTEYKLIKCYPGYNELGIIHSSENKNSEWQGIHYYHKYPEHWKKVVEKTYQILSFICISSNSTKDILVKGNKIYGPDTCCFVPQEINKLVLNSNKTRGKYPIGVRKMNNKFQAYIRDKNNQISLGVYNTIEEAFIVYKDFKENKIKKTAIDYYSRGKIGLKLYNALYNYKIEIND